MLEATILQVLETIGHIVTDPLNGIGYQFWSGIGSGSPIIVGIMVFIRKHNCQVHGCYRLQWKQWVDPEGHTHGLCKTHHPHNPPTAEHIERQANVESRAQDPS